MSDPDPGFLSPSLDALARDAGWLVARPAEDLNIGDLEDVIVFGAVPWSAWDIEAAQALHAYAREVPALVVVLFNIDDEYNVDSGGSDGLMLRRFPGADVLPHAVPVIARYRTGKLVWVEQGRVAVERVESLAGLPPGGSRRSPTP